MAGRKAVGMAGRRAMSRGARKAAGDTRVNRFATKRGAKQGYNARLDESLGASARATGARRRTPVAAPRVARQPRGLGGGRPVAGRRRKV